MSIPEASVFFVQSDGKPIALLFSNLADAEGSASALLAIGHRQVEIMDGLTKRLVKRVNPHAVLSRGRGATDQAASPLLAKKSPAGIDGA